MKLLLILSILFTFSLTAFADDQTLTSDSEDAQASEETTPAASSQVSTAVDQCPPPDRIIGKTTTSSSGDSDQPVAPVTPVTPQ